MGAGLAAAHSGDSAIAPKSPTTSKGPAAPLSSVETVAPRYTVAATPLPPTSLPTTNPRQHLTDPRIATPPPGQLQHSHQRFTAAPKDTATSVEQHLPTSTQHQVLQAVTSMPLPSEDFHPPSKVLNTVVKSQLGRKEVNAAAPTVSVEDVGGNTAFRRLQTNESLDVVNNDNEEDSKGRTHTETSPSPDAPGHAVEGQDAYAAQQQQVPSLTITAGATAAPTAGAAPFVPHTYDAQVYWPITRSASPGQALGQYDGLPLTSVQRVLEAKHKVYRICLTGGPCAGKSTMLSAMQSKIPQRMGFRVMCVPEAATLLVTGGMQWDSDLVVAQQSALLRTQLALEDQFYALAVASGVPTIVVSDRGTMDGRAFCTDEQFQEILRGVGSTMDVLRDRYDAVLHMVTAANGAEEFYNLDNPARYEDLDGARASDLRLQEMYVGHHMFRLLDNSTTFEEKIERGLQIVGQVVHKEQCAPTTPSFYLVRRCAQELPVASASYITCTTVLNNSQMNDIRLLVKREMPDGSSMHFFKSVKDMVAASAPSAHSTPRAMSRASNGASFRSSMKVNYCGGGGGGVNKSSVPSQQRIESAQRISSREYNSLKQHRDRARAEVVMQARHFIYEGANYELTTIVAPSWAAGRQTLTVESCSPSAVQQDGSSNALRLPPFLEVDREVPVERLTTAFLISHRETGALYTSLAFAPVFSRAVVTAVGVHADTENILNSTFSTPRGPSALHAETSALFVSPVGTEKPQEEVEKGPTATEAAAVDETAVPLALAAPAGRRLASLNVNSATNAPSAMSKSTPKKTVVARPQQEGPPHFLGCSMSASQPRNVVTPSRFSLSGEGDVETKTIEEAAGEHVQPERRVIARDPESILPPIEPKKVRA